MRFDVPARWQPTTIVTDEIPQKFSPYLLMGAKYFLTTGTWGSVLTQEIERAQYIFNLHHFFIEKDIVLYPYTHIDILALHILLEGIIPCIIKGTDETKLLLEANMSQLYHVPGRIRHEAIFNHATSAVSLHIDFSRSFLEKGAANYTDLQELLYNADNETGKGHYSAAAALNARDIDVIEELQQELKAAGGPEFYLDAKVEDLLRWHLQKQHSIKRQHLLQTAPFHFTGKDLDGILHIKNLVEAHIGRRYTIRDFIRITALNADIIKKGFKYVTGMTLLAYRRKICMEYAKERLLQRKHHIQKIARECGYTNVSHFIAEFKKYWNMTPGDFLKRE